MSNESIARRRIIEREEHGVRLRYVELTNDEAAALLARKSDATTVVTIEGQFFRLVDGRALSPSGHASLPRRRRR